MCATTMQGTTTSPHTVRSRAPMACATSPRAASVNCCLFLCNYGGSFLPSIENLIAIRIFPKRVIVIVTASARLTQYAMQPLILSFSFSLSFSPSLPHSEITCGHLDGDLDNELSESFTCAGSEGWKRRTDFDTIWCTDGNCNMETCCERIF